MINIRRARQEDAKDYAKILNQSWKDTYGEYISFEYIDQELNLEKLIKEFTIYQKQDELEIYIIEYEKNVVGIFEIGQPDEDYKEDMKGIGELRTLHIKKEYQHRGIGEYVLNFVYNRLNKLGYTKICLWVKKQNENAILFYKKHGFKETGYTCENPTDKAPSIVLEKMIEEKEKK